MDKIAQSCNVSELMKTESRLDKIEGQIATQAGTLTSHDRAIEEFKLKLQEQKTVKASCTKVVSKLFQRIGKKLYHIEDEPKFNWFAAAHKCASIAAHLLALDDQQELDALIPYLKTDIYYWTDINDLGEDRVYRSLTTGQDAKFLTWHNNEPNKVGKENCVHLKGCEFKMNDLDCIHKLGFICELDE